MSSKGSDGPKDNGLAAQLAVLDLGQSSTKSGGGGVAKPEFPSTNDSADTKSGAVKPELTPEECGDDLMAQLAAYDLAYPKSAKENDGFWQTVAGNPYNVARAGIAAGMVFRGNPNHAKAAAAINMMMKKDEMEGKCNRYGCSRPVGLFGSKCRCGSYRMDMINK